MIAYEGELITVHCADALDVLPTLGRESVHLVVTDPPYGVGFRSNLREQRFDRMRNDGEEGRAVVKEVLRECVRLVGQNRHLYVFGPDDPLAGLKVSERAELVWSKDQNGIGNLRSVWSPSHERISFAVSQFRHGGKVDLSCQPVRMRKRSVLSFHRRTGQRVRHPSEKPVGLLRELIESSSRQGETVLDPFGGVGSTGVAAALLGRRAILVEIEPTYAGIAAERCAWAEGLWREAGRL